MRINSELSERSGENHAWEEDRGYQGQKTRRVLLDRRLPGSGSFDTSKTQRRRRHRETDQQHHWHTEHDGGKIQSWEPTNSDSDSGIDPNRRTMKHEEGGTRRKMTAQVRRGSSPRDGDNGTKEGGVSDEYETDDERHSLASGCRRREEGPQSRSANKRGRAKYRRSCSEEKNATNRTHGIAPSLNEKGSRATMRSISPESPITPRDNVMSPKQRPALCSSNGFRDDSAYDKKENGLGVTATQAPSSTNAGARGTERRGIEMSSRVEQDDCDVIDSPRSQCSEESQGRGQAQPTQIAKEQEPPCGKATTAATMGKPIRGARPGEAIGVRSTIFDTTTIPSRTSELRAFICSALPSGPGSVLRCFIERNRKGTNKFSHVFSMYADLEDGNGRLLLSARKVMLFESEAVALSGVNKAPSASTN